MVKNDKGNKVTLNPKSTRLLTDALVVIGALLIFGFLVALALSNMGASMEAERARNLIEATHKTCAKYADSETVTRDWKIRKAEMYRCPDGRVVVLQK